MKVSHFYAVALTSTNSLVHAQQIYASNSLPLLQDDEAVAANFPEPDINLYSPAFLSPDDVPEEFENGTLGPTGQDIMEAFLQELADRNSWMTYNIPDFSSEEGRSMPYIHLSSEGSGSFDGTKTPDSGKLRFYFNGGVHGNEPAGDQAVMAFLGALDNNQTYAESVLSAAEFLIIPRYNPDGVAYFQRYLATGFDPNRDHVKLQSEQIRAIKALNVAFNAHISIDCHEYNAPRTFGPDENLTTSQDGQFSAFKNMNIHPRIRDLAEGIFAENIRTAMNAAGLRHSPYVVAASNTTNIQFTEFITDNNGDDQVGLSQGIAYLSETRGIRLGSQHFKRRVAAGLTIIRSIVDTAVANATEIYSLIETTRQEYSQSDDEIIILSRARPTNITWPLISLTNGSLIDVPIQFGNNTPGLPTLTRPRPEAYIFPACWPDVAARLRAVGVQVTQLNASWTGQVEALTITNATLATTKFEGTAQTTVLSTETALKNITFPALGGKGAYWVDSRQQRAAHAFLRLEPECESGFARWNVIPVAVGDGWPVYRVPRRG